MNEQQAENLRILIRHMETKVTRTLNMARYFEPCGTPACAWGEACGIPVLAAQGVFKSDDGLRNTIEMFGLDIAKNNDVCRLFGTESSNAWKRSDVTPQEWAAEARKVLAEYGYSMDDGFAAFKERLLNKPYEEPKWRDNGGLEMLHEYDRAQRGE